MVQINFAQKEIQCKIVYYGPGMSGKTTNLEVVHGKVPEDNRGELTSIATTGERTLYFDYMPLDLGQIAGIRTKFQLYTVPGQIYYKSTRRLVLQGVDGIVFVADSSASKLRENKESFQDLAENLKEMGKSLKDVPIIVQYNKRDLPDAMSIEELEREVNPHGFPYTEAISTKGEGVFPTLKELSGRVLEAVNKGGLAAVKPRARPAAAAAGGPVSAAPPKANAPVAAAPGGGMHGARPAAAAASTGTAVATAPPPRGGGGGAPRVPTPKSPAGGPAASAPAAASASGGGAQYQRPRSMEDRVVRVSGLKSGSSSKALLFVVLAVAIAGAAWFVLNGM